MKPEPRVVHKLLRSWLIQSIGWYALTEVVARVTLESAFVLILVILQVGILKIILAWLAFHTIVWFLFYGGFMRTWVVLGVATDVPRLRAYLTSVSEKVCQRKFARVVFLRGSAARGELNPRSDIDLCVVPQPTLRAKLGGILFWWALRADSAVRFKPLEARWIDAERYIPYHVIEEIPRFLKEPNVRPSGYQRWRSRGILMAISGIDGSGKTTAARELVSDLQGRGYQARYFYGHRQPWFNREGRPGLSLAILYESLWKRIGRTMVEWEGHRWARTSYQALTIVDYLEVRWRLSRTLQPQTIVVSDRYVADVIAYMRSWGALFVTLEGLFLSLNIEPDLPLLLEISPEDAIRRKREWDLPRLRIFAREYRDLKTLLRLVPLDASRSRAEMREALVRVIEGELGPIPIT